MPHGETLRLFVPGCVFRSTRQRRSCATFRNYPRSTGASVKHTVVIYSSILRIGDLLSLQPNIGIKLPLVALASRREKVY